MITKEKALDILDRMDFFQGQRAGRELWNEKSRYVQERDLQIFREDISELKAYIFNVVPKSEVERLQKENAELLLSETTELHLSMESLINVRVEHPIFKAIEGKVAWEIFDAFDKAIGSCEAWDHLPAVLLQLLAELKQKYSERSNDDNRTEHKETPKR